MTHSVESGTRKRGWPKGKKHTAESCAKMSKAKLGKKRGPFTDEHRAKMSRAKLGTRLTDTHRANIAAGCRARRERNGVA